MDSIFANIEDESLILLKYIDIKASKFREFANLTETIGGKEKIL